MMTGIDIIKAYRKKLDSDNVQDRYAALSFALQLPGICARHEYPFNDENIKAELYKPYKKSPTGYAPNDKKMFMHWFKMHSSECVSMHSAYMSTGSMAEDLYEFRNALTHNGVVKSYHGGIVLVDDDAAGGMVTGRFMFLPVRHFCDMVFDIAERVFERFYWDEPEALGFSESSGCGLEASFYHEIFEYAHMNFRNFWDSRTREENTLNMLYDLAFRNNSFLLNNAREYFEANPNSVYEIEQFDRHYSIVFPDSLIFFEKEYPVYPGWNDGGMYSGIVCRLTKWQFDLMLSVCDSLAAYGKNVDDVIEKALRDGVLTVDGGDGHD